MDYDVLLLHPPAIYDFRKKAIFPGPIGYTVGGSTTQFITPSIGVLSIAEYLDRHGYSVREVVDAVNRVHGQDIKAVEQPRRAGDPPSLIARVTKIHEVLDWKPQYDDLDFIVKTSLDWEKTLLEKSA